MYGILKDALDAEMRESFEKPQAAEFYEQFRAMVIEQIKDYWEQFLAAKAAQKQGAAPAVQEAPVQQAQAPVEPQASPAKSEDQGPPAVPTRDSLRAADEPAEPGE